MRRQWSFKKQAADHSTQWELDVWLWGVLCSPGLWASFYPQNLIPSAQQEPVRIWNVRESSVEQTNWPAGRLLSGGAVAGQAGQGVFNPPKPSLLQRATYSSGNLRLALLLLKLSSPGNHAFIWQMGRNQKKSTHAQHSREQQILANSELKCFSGHTRPQTDRLGSVVFVLPFNSRLTAS